MSALTFVTNAVLVVALLVTLLTPISGHPSTIIQHLQGRPPKPLRHIRLTDIRKLPKFRPTLTKILKSRSSSQTNPWKSLKKTTTLSTAVDQTTNGIELKPKGYTLDPCSYHIHCVGERLCIRADWEASCDGHASCLCMAEKTQICDECTECDEYPEESCLVGESKEAAGICGSVFTVWEGISTETDCDSFPEITPIPAHALLAMPSAYGQNGSTTYSEKNPPVPALPSSPPQKPTETTSVVSTPSAQESSTSPSISKNSLLVSNGPAPSASGFDNSTAGDDGNDGCIDAKALEHLSASKRVFKEHRRASVLCDSFGSCATPGHMVVVNGRDPMSMHSYCVQIDQGGCSRRVMEVNSPKFRRGVRVASKTSNLQFTAFAASYLTRIEEYGLRTLIHMGL